MSAVSHPGRAELLLERDGELESLRAALAEAANGEGRLALVEGPAGIGKSRLLAELRAAAEEDGARVLSARGSELEREFPFGVVRQLFEPALSDEATRERWLAGAAASAEPVFGAAVPDAPAAATDASLRRPPRPLLAHRERRRPTGRCSCRSTTSTGATAHRSASSPTSPAGSRTCRCVVGATLRSTDPGTDPALIAEIGHEPATRSVRPGPLSAEAASAMVRARLGEDAHEAFCAACAEATGGNPLLLRQLLTSLEADGVKPDAASVEVVADIGPRAVSRTVLIRLARLPDEAVSVARAVAVLGESADLPTVATLAELPEQEVAAQTAALARAEILRAEPPLGFVHPLVRDADLQGALPRPPRADALARRRAASRRRRAGRTRWPRTSCRCRAGARSGS